jgi:thioredoxin reductase
VLVCDAGQPRNAASHHLHGYLTRDGINPLELLRLAREELTRYSTVELRHALVRDVRCEFSIFHTTLDGGEEFQSRRLLLATGVVDNIPRIPGLQELYGTSVFHCPYCDGWEVSEQAIGIYGRGDKGYGLALEMTAWSRDLVLLTDGAPDLDDEARVKLERNGIRVREEKVARLEGRDGVLDRVVFESGDTISLRALFFTTGQGQRSNLCESLGCDFNDKGTVTTGEYETTHLPGLYVAGDASRAVQWVIVAAAEGAEAAFSINQSLIKEDLR